MRVAVLDQPVGAKPERPVRVQVYERKGRGAGTFDFRFIAPNGQYVGGSQGQGYCSRRGAHRALRSFLGRLHVPADRVKVEDIT